MLNASSILTLIAAVIFALVAFGAWPTNLREVEPVTLGLMVYAIGRLV